MLKIMLSATEVSGDMHAAHLVKAIKKIYPEAEFIGAGGEQMRAAGVDVKAFTTHMGTMGVVEGFKYYPSFLKIKLRMEKLLKEERPDVLILIDSRDFNLNLVKPAKKLKIPVVYYFAPQLWAWFDLKMRRASRRIDKIIAIFPFEEKLYKKMGADVLWTGHPLLDIARPTMEKEEVFKKFSLNPEKPLISLLPGSREYEIKNLLPVMLQAAKNLNKRIKDVQYAIPVAASVFKEKIMQLVSKSGIEVRVADGNIYDFMNISTLVVTASGTAALEAACLDAPMIVMYKAHITTYILAWILIKFPYVSLPNIIAEKKIVPELLQFKAKERYLLKAMLELLESPEKLDAMKRELKDVVAKLGPVGATERAAKVVVDVATKRKR
ncbi:lipid-A-disaccharide synthase [Candidatus Aerophobetes bacterium]|nr:lipid-A-disaccharide synthase [Candidatus Aerophobetes bacterium]